MKIRRISDFQARIDFPNFDSHYKKYLEGFEQSPLGQIHGAIPWQELVKVFDIKKFRKGRVTSTALKDRR